MAEIGAATGVELLPDGTMEAAAEPVRRGGGWAATVSPPASAEVPAEVGDVDEPDRAVVRHAPAREPDADFL